LPAQPFEARQSPMTKAIKTQHDIAEELEKRSGKARSISPELTHTAVTGKPEKYRKLFAFP
jgi:hypothetical protein